MSQLKLYQHIERLWSYMQLSHTLKKSDCIFVLGSNDIRVAEYAAQLFLQGWAKKLVFSGGVGRLTEGVFESSEAQTFANVARDMGVPADSILIEDRATNTGENVQLTYQLMKKSGEEFQSFILVQKPYMERRTYATFAKQWPAPYQHVCVTSPKTPFCDYFNDEIDLDMVVTAMLGDFERIKTYPALGFQTEQAVPSEIDESYAILKKVFC
ncbi:YdcF family protein [Vibrio europaeus]|uniref:YdcF family protein n=1 Tax=Vibrio europaeus TaxID=300876 RepID=A0A178JCK9_9VIBR|nr:YdcF family protein [Vibrio europaeus]MDC5703745.1 YdcF family protein [Vibrio europaeus]MDC5708301.1 YdcF family protein [Vibrio europaeus]MDC5714292.1 YdcF family protein [Vibrio europaeus]MDC5722507.1 YdcF family protein [Vibrio europaeus]MDC5727212.1 YdcF family protein [Vibrio europaeus]